MARKILRTIPEVIEAMGGDPRCAERLGVVTGALRNWKGREGYIPAVYFLLVQHELKRQKKQAHPCVFNFVPVPSRRGNGAGLPPRQADQPNHHPA